MARKAYANSVTTIPVQQGIAPQGFIVHATEPINKQQEMTVLFSLSIPAAAETDLEAKVAGSHVLSPDQQKNYQADASDVNQLVSWLKPQGFEIVQVSPATASVYAKATAAQIEQSLAVDMVKRRGCLLAC